MIEDHDRNRDGPGSRVAEFQDDADGRDLKCALGDTDETRRQTAVSRLFSRYQDQVFGWCLRYAADRERALDLAQEIFLKAYRNLHRYRPRAKFSTWLFVVTRNHCVSEARRVSLPEVLGVELDVLPGGTPDPGTLLEQRESYDRLIDLMREHLDPVEIDALHLRCFDRMPVDAITEVLGLAEKTGARAVLQRARRKLRAALSGGSEATGRIPS